jgi:outer membrane protein assembly factor BamB
VLTSEARINSPLLFGSSWREAPLAATERQFGMGSVLSSPLVVGATVYFGSTDGTLYAIE